MLTVCSNIEDALQQALYFLIRNSQKGKILFVDGANAFDPYLVLRMCGSETRAKNVLNNTLISRPFTIYQLKRLIDSELSDAVKHNNAKEVIIFGITDLFLSEDLEEQERRIILNAISQKLLDYELKNKWKIRIYLQDNPFTQIFREGLDGKNNIAFPLCD